MGPHLGPQWQEHGVPEGLWTGTGAVGGRAAREQGEGEKNLGQQSLTEEACIPW